MNAHVFCHSGSSYELPAHINCQQCLVSETTVPVCVEVSHNPVFRELAAEFLGAFMYR